MEALDDELLIHNMEYYRHYFGDSLTIPKGRIINSKIIFDIVYNSYINLIQIQLLRDVILIMILLMSKHFNILRSS